MTPYFTVYTPFHSEEYAEMAQVALASVESQNFQSFETILVVNGTKIPEWAAKESFLKNTVGVGGRKIVSGAFGTLAAAANAALSLAKGQYIVRLDADDEFSPDALSVYAAAIEVSDCRPVCVEGHWLDNRSEIQGGGLLLPVNILRSVKGYDESQPLRDGIKIIDRIMKVDPRVRISRTSKQVYTYRRHAGSLTCHITP